MGKDNVAIFVPYRYVGRKIFNIPDAHFRKENGAELKKCFAKKFNYDLFKNKKDL